MKKVEDLPAPRTRPRAPAALAGAIASTAVTRVAALVASLAIGVATARTLGPHDRGVVAVSMACIAVFSSICAAGLDTANLRFSGKSTNAHRQIITISIRFTAIAGVIAIIIWVAASLTIAPMLRFGLDSSAFILTIATCPVVLLSTLLGAAEIGRGRATTYNLVSLLSLFIYAAGAAIAIGFKAANPATVVAAYAAGQAASVVIFLTRARSVQRGGERLSPDAYRSFARRAFLPNVAQFAMLRAQIPTIQTIAGAGPVGIYAVALPLAEVLLIVPIAISLVLVPTVELSRESWQSVARMTRQTAYLTAATGVVIAISAPFAVPVLYGSEFTQAIQILWSLIPGVGLFAVARTAQSYLAGTDRPSQTVAAALAATAVTVGLMTILLPLFGPVGAGIATTAGYAVYSVVVCIAFLRARPDAQGLMPKVEVATETAI